MYKPPTASEFRLLLKKWELTGGKAANLSGLSSGRSIRSYTSGNTKVPYSVLFVLFAKCEGVLISFDWRKSE